ncbi:MAG: formylglycine-generating enzyme family protein [Bacteroidales bacterium]|jgi:formylglycine-generating enzyme required for sulfatase activity|nr:formylglycine-generating enzyme family protein [Bacteroidales bacterium]
MRNILKTFFIGMIVLSIISIYGCIKTSHPAEPDMVYVEGGIFIMGCTDEQGKNRWGIDECWGIEKPIHSVTLSSFKISKYEITQKQYESIMKINPSYFECDSCPVERVSWHDAQEFCRRLSDFTGKQYRLPTEAEWEYAARGGNKSKGYKYSGSNNIDEVAWCIINKSRHTHPVGEKLPNELGIYDMSGNVKEWCSDWYGEYFVTKQRNPTGPSSGSYRVLRGGSWNDLFANNCRVAFRSYDYPDDYNSYVGFRVVCVEK